MKIIIETCSKAGFFILGKVKRYAYYALKAVAGMLRKCKKCNGGVSSVVESWPGSAALVGG